MITDPWFYAAAIPAIFIVGLSKGGFGGALALIGVPVMALVISPVKAAAIMLPILVVMDMVGVWSYRRLFDKEVLYDMLPPAILGIGAGWALAAYVSEDQVRLVIGLVSLWFVLSYWFSGTGRDEPAGRNRPKAGLWGSFAGFTSFVSHAGGPPWQMYVLPLGLEPRLFAGTSVMFFATVNAVKLIPYFFLGQFDTANLSTSALLLPLAPIAMLIGIRVVKHINRTLFYRVTYVCVFAVGLKLVWDGAGPLFFS